MATPRVCLVLLALTLSTACLGVIGDTEPANRLAEEVPGGTRGEAAACADVAPVFGKTAMRRLNQREMTHAVRDVLDDQTLEVTGFPADAYSAMGFDTDDVSTRTPPLDTEKILGVIASVITQRLTRPGTPLAQCESASNRAGCLQQALPALLRRAFRAPATADDVAALVGVALEPADAREGTINVLTAILASPRFMFHVVDYTRNRSGNRHELSGYELAQRLAFFLWSSIPDDALLDAARDGTLDRQDGLHAEVRRMLADPRASAFITNFPAQWLGYRKLDTLQRSAVTYPTYDAALRASMRAEAELLFEEVLTEELPADVLVTADHTYVDARLARHYGMAAPPSSGFARVPLDGVKRRGLLTQAAVMTASSETNEPSPIRRGIALLDHVLCLPMPNPPDGVATLERIDPALPMRDRLAQHRSDPSCAACHNTIDPMGLAFGNFDAIGGWRDLDQGKPIDSSGVTPDGVAFTKAGELAAWIGEGDKLEQCLAEHLSAYAVGRVVRGRETCQMTAWLGDVADGESLSLAELIERMVTSAWFRTSTVID